MDEREHKELCGYSGIPRKNALDEEDARPEIDVLIPKLYLRAEQGWIGSNAEQYENGFERFKGALRAYMAKENPVALSVALEQAGLDAQPAELNQQLTYAARQLADADERQITRLPEESFNLKGNESGPYSFKTLSEKDEMEITPLEDISNDELEEYQKKTTRDFAKEIITDIKDRNGSTYLYNKDTGKNIMIAVDSIKHTIGRTLQRSYVQVAKNLDSIIKNAVAINELAPRDKTTNGAVILLGMGETKDQSIIARMVVDNRTWKMKDYDILYSISKHELKKWKRPVIKDARVADKSDSGTASTGITIPELLNLVKDTREVSSVLSKDVSEKLGITRPRDPALSDSLIYNLKDDEYMEAVESGDTETAQEMADEAAKAAGYTPVTRYHQTDKEFTEFKTDNPVAGANDSETPNGIFFKENDHDIGVGGDYVKTGHGGDIQMRVYLKADNMLHFKNRTEAAAWYKKNVPGYQELRDEWEQLYNEKYKPQFDALEEEQFDPDTTPERYEELDEIEEKLIREMGEEERANAREQRALLDEYFLHGNSPYDGIELDYDGHRYIDGKRENVHTFIVFDASQVKSADAITYDDAGNVIPLSQRFNTQSNDIRYNLKDDGGDIVNDVKDDADLYAQAMSDQEIRDSLESAGRLLAFIQQNSLRQKDTESWKKWTREYAKKVLTETGSKYSAQKLQKELNQVYEAIDKGGYNAGELMIRLRELGRRVLEAAPGVVVEMDETTKAARDALKTGAFYLTDDQKEAIQLRYGSLGAYMRKNFGKLAIRKKAQGTQKGARSSLADVWAESLSPLLPSVFAQDTIEADMPEIIDAFLETSGEKKYAGEFGRNIGQYATSLGLEILRDYLNAPFIQDSIGKLREGMEALGRWRQANYLLEAGGRQSTGDWKAPELDGCADVPEDKTYQGRVDADNVKQIGLNCETWEEMI